MTIAICVAGTMATRFLPFLIFREGRLVPPYVQYLGKNLTLKNWTLADKGFF